MAEHYQHVWKYLYRLIYSRVLQSAQFYLIKVATLAYAEYSKIAKSSPPLFIYREYLKLYGSFNITLSPPPYVCGTTHLWASDQEPNISSRKEM